jgi:hypothetical protein
MSNLSQYRVSIGVFSLGLLWVVSEVVGDGQQPGALDNATTTIVHRLDAAGDQQDETQPRYALAASETDSAADPEEWDQPARGSQARHAASPWAITQDDGEAQSAEPEAGDSELPPPDVGMIHK